MSTALTARLETAIGGWLLAMAGSAGFLAVFSGHHLLAPVALGAAIGAAAAVVMAEAWARANVAALLGLTVVGALVALREPPGVLLAVWGADGLGAIRDSLAPVRATPEALAVPYLAAVLAAFVGTSSARRQGWGWLGLSPSLAAMVLAFVVGDDLGPVSWWVPAAWVALALLLLSWRPDGAPTQKLLRGGAALLVLAVVVGVAAVPLGERLPVREQRWVVPSTAGVDAVDGLQPLLTVVELQSGPDDVLFLADTSAPVQRWRLAVLDRYDGRSWSMGTPDFRPAAPELPSAAGMDSPAGEPVEQAVEVQLPEGEVEMPWGPWLPVADGVVETSVDGLLYDRQLGAVMLADGDLPPLRYDVTSRPHPGHDDDRIEAMAAADSIAEDNLDVSRSGRRSADDMEAEVLDDLYEVANLLTADASSDYGKAAALASYLVGYGEVLVGDDANTGHTLSHVRNMLLDETGRLDPEGTVGTSEQFATTFAVMARLLDLPTRVVVGFDGAGAPGVVSVSAHDANTWAEVRFDGLGWVPFDVVPIETGDVEPEPIEAEDDEAGDDADEDGEGETEQDEPADAAASTPEQSSSEMDRSFEPPNVNPFILSAAVGLALLLLALLPAIWRGMRRRRRRQGDTPGLRVAGAWATVLDDLGRGGIGPLAGQNATDVATAGGKQVPQLQHELLELSMLTNRARFSSQDPAAQDGDRAWTLAESIVAARRRTLTRAQHIREYFSFR